MALDSLAPDQRAVVQLVLQQGRSYAELAGLLGISEEAVRQRAQAGLNTLGGATGGLSAADEGLLADFLLGQQGEAEGEAAEALLADSPEAHAWAEAVAGQLAPVARRGLPELPPAPSRSARPAAAAPAPPEPEPEPDPQPEATPEPTVEAPAARTRRDRPRRPRPKPESAEAPSAPRARRERPQRPRREAAAGTRQTAEEGDGGRAAAPAASRLGGFLLIASLGILVAVLIAYMVGRDGDETASTAQTTSQPATSTATTPQPLAQLPLRGVGETKAEGLVQLNQTAQGQVGFTLAARNVTATSEGQAYAVWLIGKGQPARRLGFAGPVGEDGTLAISGPREGDQAKFVGWLQEYSQMVVSRETTEQTDDPTEVVLRASLASLGESGQAEGGTATPAP